MTVNWKKKLNDKQLIISSETLSKITIPENGGKPKEAVHILREIVKEKRTAIDYAVQPAGSKSLVENTSPLIMERNLDRKLGIIVNDGSVPIYIALGLTATLNAGIRLNANGGCFQFGTYTDCFWVGDVSAI